MTGLVFLGAVPPQPDASRTPTNQPGGTGAEAHLPEGGLPFPPGDFLQNIIQMAAGAALRGQPGQQGDSFFSLIRNVLFLCILS